MTPDDRIKELEAENARLRAVIEAVQAALHEVRVAWVEEHLLRLDRETDTPEPAQVLPWRLKDGA